MSTLARTTLFILFLWLRLGLLSQTIFVYDQQTGDPVSNVYIFNDQKTATSLTNNLGIADLKSFSKNDIIHFQHPSYNELSLDLMDINNLSFKIPLNQKLIRLEEVVVSANRWETETYEVPNKINIIKSKNIIFDNPPTTADMLTEAPGVFVQKSQLGGGSPMIRGFAANRILFMVDGVRMNNAIYRSGNLQNVLQADINSVESTEVIYGPGTNIYGSDALGGVIDVHLLKPAFADTKKWKAFGHASVRFASAAVERTAHADVNVGNNKWSILTSLSYTAFDDLVMGTMHNDYNLRKEYVKTENGHDTIISNGSGRSQRYSGYKQLSFITKIKNKITENTSWTYGFYITRTSDVPRYDRLLQYSGDHLKYAEWYYKPQEWMMNRLSFDFEKPTALYDEMNIRLGYQFVQEGRNDRKFQNEWRRERVEKVHIISLNNDYYKALKKQQHLFYGLELVYNQVLSTGEKNNIYTGESKKIASRYPDGGTDYFTSGLYLTYKKNFKVPLTVIGGLRYSYTMLDSKIEDTSFYHLPYNEIKLGNGALTGNAGLVYHPGTWQLHINLSSGFRAPNLDDVAKVFDSEPGNVVVPNPDLKPEYIYSADARIIKSFQNTANIELSGFYSYLDQAIVRRDFQLNGQDSIIYDGEMSKVEAMVNAGYAHIYGASFLFRIQFIRHFVFSTSATYIHGEDNEGYALRHAPPLFGRSSLSFEIKKLKLEAFTLYNAEVSYENLAPSERSKTYLYATDENGNPYAPAWWTLNFRGSYAFNEKFLITFGFDNILNYRYRPYSSGITAPGRNIILAFRYAF
jgi:hemoglobin/transferrin/lactoferrin receptor protein